MFGCLSVLLRRSAFLARGSLSCLLPVPSNTNTDTALLSAWGGVVNISRPSILPCSSPSLSRGAASTGSGRRCCSRLPRQGPPARSQSRRAGCAAPSPTRTWSGKCTATWIDDNRTHAGAFELLANFQTPRRGTERMASASKPAHVAVATTPLPSPSLVSPRGAPPSLQQHAQESQRQPQTPTTALRRLSSKILKDLGAESPLNDSGSSGVVQHDASVLSAQKMARTLLKGDQLPAGISVCPRVSLSLT